MTQMINLLNSIPKAPVDKSLFAPENTRKIIIVLIGVFLLHMGDAIISRIEAGSAFDKASSESILAQDVLDDMRAKYPDPKKTVIETRAKDIEQQIVFKKNMLAYLNGDALSKQGFTPFLSALSNDIVPGVWLTLIDIDMSERFIGLKGMSVSGPLIVKFVDHLSKDKVFQNIKMGLFKIDQSEEKGSFMVFQLSNQVHRSPGSSHDEPQ